MSGIDAQASLAKRPKSCRKADRRIFGENVGD